MLRYTGYLQDHAKMMRLLGNDKQSGGTPALKDLIEVASLACNYFSNLIKEEKYFVWLSKADGKWAQPTEMDFNNLIIPQVKDLLAYCGHDNPSYIEQLEIEIYNSLRDLKTSNQPGSSLAIEDKIKKLQLHVCAQSAMLRNNFAGKSEAQTQKKGSFLEKVKKGFKRLAYGIGFFNASLGLYDKEQKMVHPDLPNPIPQTEQVHPKGDFPHINPNAFEKTKNALSKTIFIWDPPKFPPVPPDEESPGSPIP